MEMATKNVCEVLIFRPLTIGKLTSSLKPGETVGGGRGGGGKTARTESALCLYIYVLGILGFILIYSKLLS